MKNIIIYLIILRVIICYQELLFHDLRVNVLCAPTKNNIYFCIFCNNPNDCDEIIMLLIHSNGEYEHYIQPNNENLYINSYKTALLEISDYTWVGIFEDNLSISNGENFGKITFDISTKTLTFQKYFSFKSNTQVMNIIKLNNNHIFFGTALYNNNFIELYTFNENTFECQKETPFKSTFLGKNLVNCVQFEINNELGCFYDNQSKAYFFFTNNYENPIALTDLDSIEGVKYIKINNDKIIVCSLFTIIDTINTFNYACAIGIHNQNEFILGNFQVIFNDVLKGTSSTSPLIINNMDFVFMDDNNEIILFAAGEYDGFFISKFIISNDNLIQIGDNYFIKLHNIKSAKILVRYILKHSETLATIVFINYQSKRLIFYQYTFPSCFNFTFYQSINHEINLDFSQIINNITFTEFGIMSTNITFNLNDTSKIFELNNPYKKTEVSLICSSNIVNKYIFSYYLQNNDDESSSEKKYLTSNLCYGQLIFCNENCNTCTGEDNLCLTCKTNYVFKDIFGNCVLYEDIPINYYEDVSTSPSIYKECNELCLTCSSQSDNLSSMCNSCIENYSLMPNLNCILTKLMPTTYYLDTNENKFKYCTSNPLLCTNDTKCDLNYPILIENKGQCIESCDSMNCDTCENGNQLIQLGNYCYLKINNNDNSFSIELNNIKDSELSKVIKEGLKNLILSGTITFVGNNNNSFYMIYDTSLSDSYITKVNNNNNLSSIDLGECQSKLESLFPTPLIIIKNDEINSSELKSKTSFLIFDSNYNQIDYNYYCSGLKIVISYPIQNTNQFDYDNAYSLYLNGYDVFDSKNKFFNDICSTYSSKNGNDVTLKDRQHDYYQEVNFCDNCTYSSFDYENNNVNCICTITNTNQENENKNELLKDLKTQFKTMFISETFYVVKCYKLIFNWNYFKTNYGCWILLVLLIIHIILCIYFFIDNLKNIRKALKVNTNLNDETCNNENKNEDNNQILEEKNHHIKISSQIELKNGANPPIKIKKIRNGSNIIESIETIESKKSDTNNNISGIQNLKNLSIEKYIKEDNQESKSSLKNSFHSNNKKSKFYENKSINDGNLNSKNEIDDNELSNLNLSRKKYDYELFCYEEAERLDHRNASTFYFDYLSDKQSIFNVIVNNSILDMRHLKLDRLILTISLDFFFNAVFFTDNYISRKYKNNSLSFLVGLPKTIFSNLIAFFICGFLNYLSNNKIEQIIKNEKFSDEFKLIGEKILKLYKTKLIYYFIISTLIMFICFYFVSVFCAVYKNIQVNWIISSLQSCAIVFIIPFIFGIIVMIVWRISLSFRKKNLYKFSKWLRSM